MALMTTDNSAERPEPKHTHYVSMSNGGIYRAQRAGSRGYEDEHPEDWRPATPAEVQMFNEGKRTVLAERPRNLGAATVVSPRAITLAEDDEPATADGTFDLPRIQNPEPLPPAPPAPPPPLHGIPGVPPAPPAAFGGDPDKSE